MLAMLWEAEGAVKTTTPSPWQVSPAETSVVIGARGTTARFVKMPRTSSRAESIWPETSV